MNSFQEIFGNLRGQFHLRTAIVASHELFSRMLMTMQLIGFVYIAKPKISRINLSTLFVLQGIVLHALVS